MTARRGSSLRAAIVTLVAGLLIPAGARAQSQESLETPRPSRTAVVLDLLILRPVGLLVVPVGVAAFIPVALITAPNGKEGLQSALELFVTGPVNYVFQRPLGEI